MNQPCAARLFGFETQSGNVIRAWPCDWRRVFAEFQSEYVLDQTSDEIPHMDSLSSSALPVTTGPDKVAN